MTLQMTENDTLQMTENHTEELLVNTSEGDQYDYDEDYPSIKRDDSGLEDWRYNTQLALEHCGLDWTVSKRKMGIFNSEGELVPINEGVNRRWLVRDDNEFILGMVSDGYEICQNHQAFNFFDIFLHERDCFISECGSFSKGRKIYVQAQISDLKSLEIVEGDTVAPYLLLATSHDQSLKSQVRFVNTRVICQNTLMSALSEDVAFRGSRHTKGMHTRLKDIKDSIDLYKRSFTNKAEEYRAMANTEMTTSQFKNYLEVLFEKELASKNSSKREKPATLETLKAGRDMLSNFESTPDLQMDKVRGTVWAGFNAVTQWYTHTRGEEENRQSNVLLGEDSKALKLAEELALSLV